MVFIIYKNKKINSNNTTIWVAIIYHFEETDFKYIANSKF